jgi:hypothetical protein
VTACALVEARFLFTPNRWGATAPSWVAPHRCAARARPRRRARAMSTSGKGPWLVGRGARTGHRRPRPIARPSRSSHRARPGARARGRARCGSTRPAAHRRSSTRTPVRVRRGASPPRIGGRTRSSLTRQHGATWASERCGRVRSAQGFRETKSARAGHRDVVGSRERLGVSRTSTSWPALRPTQRARADDPRERQRGYPTRTRTFLLVPARVWVAVVGAQAHAEGEPSCERVEAIARGVPATAAGAGRLDGVPAATGLTRLELERHAAGWERAALETAAEADRPARANVARAAHGDPRF